jgi:hypothetical protein
MRRAPIPADTQLFAAFMTGISFAMPSLRGMTMMTQATAKAQPQTTSTRGAFPRTVMLLAHGLDDVRTLREALQEQGFLVLVREQLSCLIDDIEALQPDALIFDPASPQVAFVARVMRRHFAHLYQVAVTRTSSPVWRGPEGPDLVLPATHARIVAAQVRCWARYV